MQVMVLGMHRSGTSVLARILNLMGLYLGPEGMSTGANPENPKGFWERRDVRFLNDALLHSVRCDWDRVSGFDSGAVPADMAEAFDEVARRTVLEMDANRPWFMKEPRLCLLFPFWRRHLEVPVVVNIYRDPVEVAASLQQRSGIPMEAGLELWEYYVRSSAQASADLPSVSILHGTLMRSPEEVALRLHDELTALGVEGIRRATQRELKGFIDAGLYRQRRGQDRLQAYRQSRQSKLFERLEAGAEGVLLEDWPSRWPQLESYEHGLPAVIPFPSPRRVRASGYDVFMLDERLKSSVRRVGRLEERLNSHLDRWSAELERTMGAASGGGTLNTEEDLRAKLEQAVSLRDQAECELEQRYAELAASAREVADAATRDREREVEFERYAAQQAVVQQELELLKEQRDKDVARIRSLKRRLGRKDDQLTKSRREVRSLVSAVEEERRLRQRLDAELTKLLSSRSWRMSAPLRSLARGLRRLRR